MGAWGTGLLQDDTALDAFGDIAEARSLAPILPALIQAGEYIEVDAGNAAIAGALAIVVAASPEAAAALPALANLTGPDAHPDDAARYQALTETPLPPLPFVGTIGGMLRVLTDPERSEIAALWQEAGEEELGAWSSEVQQLSTAFDAVAVQLFASAGPASSPSTTHPPHPPGGPLARPVHFYRNVGPLFTLLNLFVLGLFLVYPLISIAGRGGGAVPIVVATGVALSVLLLPRLFQPLLLKNAGAIMRVLGLGQWAIIAVILLNSTQAVPIPSAVLFAVYLVFVLGVALNFWIMSDPRVITPRHAAALASR